MFVRREVAEGTIRVTFYFSISFKHFQMPSICSFRNCHFERCLLFPAIHRDSRKRPHVTASAEPINSKCLRCSRGWAAWNRAAYDEKLLGEDPKAPLEAVGRTPGTPMRGCWRVFEFRYSSTLMRRTDQLPAGWMLLWCSLTWKKLTLTSAGSPLAMWRVAIQWTATILR